MTPLCLFTFQLSERTYWPYAVINVKASCQHRFGAEGQSVQVDLVDRRGVTNTVSVEIDRTANPNCTPRLYFQGNAAEAYESWKRIHRKMGGIVVVNVVGQNHIRIEP